MSVTVSLQDTSGTYRLDTLPGLFRIYSVIIATGSGQLKSPFGAGLLDASAFVQTPDIAVRKDAG